jgi:hypothetical protein
VGVALAEGLGFIASQNKSHRDVVQKPTILKLDPISVPAFFYKATRTIELNRGSVGAAHEQLYFVTGGARPCPVEQVAQHEPTIPTVPVTKVNTHVEPHNVRDLLSLHGVQACVAYDAIVKNSNHVLPAACGCVRDAVDKRFRLQLVRERHEQSGMRCHHLPLGIAEAVGVGRCRVTNEYGIAHEA